MLEVPLGAMEAILKSTLLGEVFEWGSLVER